MCFLVAVATLAGACQDDPRPVPLPGSGVPDVVGAPYQLDVGLQSRSITAENPGGKKGLGGRAASRLGEGRKGSPNIVIGPGETATLVDIDGPGTIRHVWMTTFGPPALFRSLVFRAYWDGQKHPSIEAPLGDVMGFAHGRVQSYESAAHSLGQKAGMNLWLPMPFVSAAKVTLTNETARPATLYYQFDYTLGDAHDPGTGRLHASFRRENPTTPQEDFVIMQKREGTGRYLGAVLGIRPLSPDWWGEGEVKIYLDGDRAFPTICGTGAEDYVGLSWKMQETPFRYHGCSLNRDGFVTLHRWHLTDPIYWREDATVTIQQIGFEQGLVERSDDWSATAFWYEPIPSAPLPPLPSLEVRVRDLWPGSSTVRTNKLKIPPPFEQKPTNPSSTDGNQKPPVVPANAGTQSQPTVGSRLRGNDRSIVALNVPAARRWRADQE